MKKRSCERFNIPGTTLYYRSKPSFFVRRKYSSTYYPVIDFSRGGAKFLCDERLKAGSAIIVKFNIPGIDEEPELKASVRWISKNPEKSYKYQTGIAFNSYGSKKDDNPQAVLSLIKKIEFEISK